MPGLLDGESPLPGLLGMLAQTWPARLAQNAWQAVKLPGDVYQGNVSTIGPDGRTNPEIINRSVDLAGLVTGGAGVAPAGANELRAGIRTYQNVPDSLMGFRKSGPQRGFNETNYPHVQDIQVVMPPTPWRAHPDIWTDQIKGMNPNHALERAYRSWPDAWHITALK